MKLKILVAIAFPAAAVVAVAAQANFQPVVAKYRETTTQISPEGKSQILRQVEGNYFRSSAGKIRTDRANVTNGVTDAAVIEIQDPQTGKLYRFTKGDNRVSTAPLPPSTTPEVTDSYLSEAKKHATSEQVVNGVHCFGFPVYKTAAGKPGKELIGTGWRSLENNLHVKTETDEPGPNGTRVRSVREIYDVQLGVEPDEHVFDLPAAQ